MALAITQQPPSASSRARPGCRRNPPAWMRWSETPPEGRASFQPQMRRLDLSRLVLLRMCVRCAPSPTRTDADGPHSDGPGRGITVLDAADCRSSVTDRTRHET